MIEQRLKEIWDRFDKNCTIDDISKVAFMVKGSSAVSVGILTPDGNVHDDFDNKVDYIWAAPIIAMVRLAADVGNLLKENKSKEGVKDD